MRIPLLYFLHILGFFYFLGIPENIVKINALFFIVLVLFLNVRKLKIYKFQLYLFLFIVFVFQNFGSYNDFIDYGFPFILFFVGSFLFPLYKDFKEEDVKFHIRNLIYISLVGVFFKLILHGVDESFLIGFLSMSAGQLGFLFPALMLVFIFELFKDNKTRFLFFIALFLFGILNEKRTVVFFFPIIVFYYYGFSILKINRMFLIFILYCFSLSLIPSLNPDEKIFGRVDLLFPFSYALDYLTATYDGGLQGNTVEALTDSGAQYGRISLLKAIYGHVSNFTNSNFFLGHGIGTFTVNQSVDSFHDDKMYILFGFRGVLSAFLVVLLDSGFIALIFFMIFLYKFFIHFFRQININYILLLIVFYDIFFYSDAFLKILPISVYLFTLFPFVFFRKIK